MPTSSNKNGEAVRPCILEAQRDLCRLLVVAGVPQDPRWTSLILYMRSLEFNEALSLSQRAGIQQLLLATLGDKDFSDAKYRTICRMQEKIVTSRYTDLLDMAMRETKALYGEFEKILGSRRGDVRDLGDMAVESVESGESPDKIVRKLRSSFHKVLQVMDEDAKRLEQVAYTDALTGLANRRRFDEVMAGLAQKGAGKPLALLLGDLDYFKNVNDCFGHAVGDQTLQVAANCIRKVVSASAFSDALCSRFGGEEFTVVLPGVDGDDAYVLAERIREEVESVRFDVRSVTDGKLHRGQSITISIGVGVLEGGEGAFLGERLLEEADAALYRAKRGGRNQVVVSNSGS